MNTAAPMYRLLLLTSLLGSSLVLASAGPADGQPGKKLPPTTKSAEDGKYATVVAEGVGKDEKDAKKAAFRDAVSRVVGTLVDAETLVRNDEVISERILEFSGGFVKTYDVLKSEKTPDGLTRVRIKATVERLQLSGRLADANVTTTEVRGEDLLAEKLTKDEAQKGATELLAKLYGDLPRLLKAEVKGKLQLTDVRDGVNVDVTVSADTKGYESFLKRAMPLLDKIALRQDTVLVAGEKDSQGLPRYARRAGEFAHLPELGEQTPKGYAIWLLQHIDGTGSRMRWRLFWVDADMAKSMAPLVGEVRVHIQLNDRAGNLVSEDEVPLYLSDSDHNWYGRRSGDWGLTSQTWLLWNYARRSYRVGNEPRETATLYIAPLVTQLMPSHQGGYVQSTTFRRKVKLTAAELGLVNEVKTSVVLHPTEFGKSR